MTAGDIILLVGTPSQAAILAVAAETLPFAAVLNPTRRRMPPLGTTVITSRDEAIARNPGAICILTPFSGMDDFIREAARSGARILTSGPLDMTRRKRESLRELLRERDDQLTQANGVLTSSLHRSLRAQRDRDEFGKAVYVRIVSGGGTDGLTAGWWKLWALLEQSLDLLHSPLQKLTVVASRAGRKLHATLSVTVSSRASALVSVLPCDLASGSEILLLGTGGTVSSQAHFNAIPVYPSGGRPSLLFDRSTHPEPELIDCYVKQLDGTTGAAGFRSALDPSPLSSRLLKGLRTALRTGRITEIQLP